MTIHLHHDDLPADVADQLRAGDAVAVDSETMGLNPLRDRLCVVQLSAGDGDAHLVKFAKDRFDAPNLCAVLGDPGVLKLFHFARFDIAVMLHYLGVVTAPVYCTKIASKLVRTYTDRHGLRDLCRETIGVDVDKGQQSSDWGADSLSDAQKSYAAGDVLYLHRVRQVLDIMLDREGRRAFAEDAFAFLPTRARLDLAGFEGLDIFAHS
ncbi:ribonuclease D [Yunchengibacter salinarum]|uniref:ribonuclease D n=1 Tax=Yunchengibacter salinarum TaxID=3133399 RepID=UPI0035B6A3DD